MKRYFDRVDVLDLRKIEVRLGRENGVFYAQQPLSQYDCIYLKGSFRYADLLRSVASFLEGKIAYMPLSSSSFTVVHNKLLTHIALQQQGIPMPITYLSSTVDGALDILKIVHYPVVIKLPGGTQGRGVMFADSFSSASSFLDALSVLHQPFIIQEYVETEGTDVRAFVVGEKVVAAMRRKSQREEKRANIHAGGQGERVELSREACQVAVNAARVLGAEICGVDILESPLGPLVIEANLSPGLQGITEVTHINIADEVARHLARRTRETLTSQEPSVREVVPEPRNAQEILSSLQFRGDRIVLPDFVTKLSNFREGKEYLIKAKKGKVEIVEG